MNVKDLKEAIPVLFSSNITPVVHGGHGIGKSQVIRQVCEDNGWKMADFRLGQCPDSADIIGLFDTQESRDYSVYKIPKRIHDLIDYANKNPDSYAVLFFDELNRTSKDVLQSVFQIVLDNEVAGTKLPNNFKCVCGQNPATDDYVVLDFDDKAFKDRFCHIKFEPTVKEWLSYARKIGVDGSITAFISDQSEMLEGKLQEFSLDVTPSRRSWMAVDRIKSNTNNAALFNELTMGMVGTAAAGAYLSFLENFDESINPLNVLNDFKKVKKMVETHSNPETDRTDILQNTCDGIKDELKKLNPEKGDLLSKAWEKNLADYIVTIPKGLAFAFLQSLFDVPISLKTEADPNQGLAGNKSAAAKKIYKHFKGFNEAQNAAKKAAESEANESEVSTDE